MAMNVNFKKGLKASLPSTRDANTFYYVSDEFALYLGEHLISNEVTLEQFNALAARVKNLEDWKAALTEFSKDSGANDLVKVTVATEAGAVKSVTVDDTKLDEKLTADLNEAKKHADDKIGTLKIENTEYNTVVDYVIAKTTGIATDSVVAGKADKVVPNKVDNIAILTADGNLSDSGKTIAEVEQEVKDYTDAEIVGLEFALSEDGKTLELKNKSGVSVATLDTTEFVVDGFLTRVEADQTNNKLTFYWNTDSGEQSTVIELSSIADIYTGSTDDNGVNVAVSNENIISASLSDNVKADIAKGVAAKVVTDTIGNYVLKSEAPGYDDIWTENEHNAFVEANKEVLNSGITKEKVDAYDVTKKTVDDNKDTWNKAGTAIQSITIMDTVMTDPLRVSVDDQGNAAIDLSNVEVKNASIAQTAYSADYAIDAANADNAKNAVYAESAGSANSLAEAAEENLLATALSNAKSVIQGETTNTIKDCVDAINTLNDTIGTVDSDNKAIIGTVNNVVAQLTWGEF